MEADGGTLARLALQHLFRVYGDLWDDFMLVADGQSKDARPSHLRALTKYGIINCRGTATPVLSGMMIRAGMEQLRLEPLAERSESKGGVAIDPVADVSAGGEWADELALIGRRRNVLERRLRMLIVDMLRFEILFDKTKPSVSQRVLASLPENRRGRLDSFHPDDLMERLFLAGSCSNSAARVVALLQDFQRPCAI